MRYILFIILVIINSFATDVKPTLVIEASGGVNDIHINNQKIYVATQASSVDIFDLKTKKLIQKIKVPQIKDFTGDVIDAKIYNVDSTKKSILLTVQATSGYRELYLYNNKLKKLISEKDKLYISKALFLDDTHILFCTLGNVMHLYDVKLKKTIWTLDIKAPDADFNSTFADFVLDKKKTIAIVADESGDLKIVNLKQKRVVEVLSGENLDKVFKVDLKNNKIITAGQDRRCVVYDLKTKNAYYLTVDFLIYAAALSPSGTYGAYSSDENNDVVVFNTNTKSKIYKLTKNLMTLSDIIFVNEDELFVTSDSNKFNYYKLK
jgi:WD40 repeat protein